MVKRRQFTPVKLFLYQLISFKVGLAGSLALLCDVAMTRFLHFRLIVLSINECRKPFKLFYGMIKESVSSTNYFFLRLISATYWHR